MAPPRWLSSCFLVSSLGFHYHFLLAPEPFLPVLDFFFFFGFFLVPPTVLWSPPFFTQARSPNFFLFPRTKRSSVSYLCFFGCGLSNFPVPHTRPTYFESSGTPPVLLGVSLLYSWLLGFFAVSFVIVTATPSPTPILKRWPHSVKYLPGKSTLEL